MTPICKKCVFSLASNSVTFLQLFLFYKALFWKQVPYTQASSVREILHCDIFFS